MHIDQVLLDISATRRRRAAHAYLNVAARAIVEWARAGVGQAVFLLDAGRERAVQRCQLACAGRVEVLTAGLAGNALERGFVNAVALVGVALPQANHVHRLGVGVGVGNRFVKGVLTAVGRRANLRVLAIAPVGQQQQCAPATHVRQRVHAIDQAVVQRGAASRAQPPDGAREVALVGGEGRECFSLLVEGDQRSAVGAAHLVDKRLRGFLRAVNLVGLAHAARAVDHQRGRNRARAASKCANCHRLAILSHGEIAGTQATDRLAAIVGHTNVERHIGVVRAIDLGDMRARHAGNGG